MTQGPENKRGSLRRIIEPTIEVDGIPFPIRFLERVVRLSPGETMSMFVFPSTIPTLLQKLAEFSEDPEIKNTRHPLFLAAGRGTDDRLVVTFGNLSLEGSQKELRDIFEEYTSQSS